MKHILLVVPLLLMSCLVQGQGGRELVDNFLQNKDNIIYWNSIQETDLSQTELVDAVIETGLFTHIDVAGNKVVCELRPYKLNYEKHGYTLLSVPAFLINNLVTGTVVFELKEDRYRAIVKNLRFINNTDDGFGIVYPLEYYVLNRQQEIRFSLFKDCSDLLNKDFLQKTILQKPDSNW